MLFHKSTSRAALLPGGLGFKPICLEDSCADLHHPVSLGFKEGLGEQDLQLEQGINLIESRSQSAFDRWLLLQVNSHQATLTQALQGVQLLNSSGFVFVPSTDVF